MLEHAADIWSALFSLAPISIAMYLGAAALALAGLLGTMVPGLPGLPLIFAAGFLAGWAGHFEIIGWKTLTLLGLLTLAGMAAEWTAQLLGAKKAGGSWLGMTGAVLGTILGLFTGLWGVLFLPLAGAFLGELIARRDVASAGSVGVATWLGMLIGEAIRLVAALAMIAVIVVRLLF